AHKKNSWRRPASPSSRRTAGRAAPTPPPRPERTAGNRRSGTASVGGQEPWGEKRVGRFYRPAAAPASRAGKRHGDSASQAQKGQEIDLHRRPAALTIRPRGLRL